MMYLYSIQYMSVDHANFCIMVILSMLLGGQTKEASLFTFSVFCARCPQLFL